MMISDYFREKEKKFGLALGGGAALGAAHIGVMRALEELELSAYNKADTRQTKKLIDEGYEAAIMALQSSVK
ncbi:MAG: hypothetical protein EA360_06785 [Balneolaceae bacterium]|nr:MAG: hypothetical protein EA360_06785 [Balneolaceae bacterium]